MLYSGHKTWALPALSPQSVLEWRVNELIAHCCEIEPCCWGWGSSPTCVSDPACPLRQAGACTQAMSLFLHGFLCSSTHFPEWLNISQHTALMVATQPCDLCNSSLVWAGEIVELLLLHQGLLWTEPWGFYRGHQSPSSPPKDKKPFSAGVQMPVGLQCGCPTSVTKRGGVCPCPPSPFWVYDLPLKGSLSTHEIFTLFVQLCVFLKTKIKRSFPISGKRCSQPGCYEMLLGKFTNLRTQLHGSSAVCLTGSRVTALTLLIHQTKFHSWFLSLKTSFSPSSF